MLFQSLYQSESDIYFIQCIFELEGLNTNYWYKAWHTVISRYDSLRASFMWEGLDEPVQIIHKEIKLSWVEEDWRKQTNQKERLQELIQSERKKGFDLSKAPLMRWNLIKISNDRYYFIWNMHHVLIDGWCGPIILGEVTDVYKSLINDEVLKLKARRPYRDYISWLLRQDQGRAKEYWKEELLGAVPTRLADKQIAESDESGECILTLDIKDTNLLNNYAKSLGVTVNTVLQGIWGVLLSKYTRQDDVVFGVTVSGRNIDLPGVEDMVGIFINTLPMRIKFRPSETLKELLKRLQIQMSEAQSYGYIPLSTIQSLQSERNLFDNIFIYENYPLTVKPNIGKNRLLIKAVIEKTEYAITILIVPGNTIKIKMYYYKKYFSKPEMEEIYKYLRSLIISVCNNKCQYIGNLSLADKNKQGSLIEWNRTDNNIYQKSNYFSRFSLIFTLSKKTL